MSKHMILYQTRKKIAGVFCFIRGIMRWLDTGRWIPHTYVEITPLLHEQTYKDVFVSNRGIRIKHFEETPYTPDEILIKNVPVRRFNCKKCGKYLITFDNTCGEEYNKVNDNN